jgi:parallel beta-helix repeat protein
MKRHRALGRRMRLEALEDRRMLAVFTVDDDFAANDPAEREFTTIQAAVDAASAGDKINVKPGTYEENVVVNKQLKIKGADASLDEYRDSTEASIVDPLNNTTTGGVGIGFDLQADGIEIKGFTIGEFDSNTDPDGTIGIRTSDSFSGYKIKDNVIEENTIGIYLNTATTASEETSPDLTKVEDNVVRNNDRNGSNSGNGIYSDLGLQNVKIKDNLFTGTNDEASIKIVATDDDNADTLRSDITIKDNNFEDLSGAGIYFENVVDSLIDDNDLENLALSGIQLNGGNEGVTIKRNDLHSVGTEDLYGIILSDENEIDANVNNLVKRNRITGAGLTGLVIRDSSSNTIERNKVEGSLGGSLQFADEGNGISLENADGNTFIRNKSEDNARHGIFLDSSSTGNTFKKNKSKDNAVEVVTAFDYNDSTTGGTGPSGVQNTYEMNKGVTENVTGLIATFID